MLLAFGLTSCATSALWKDHAFDGFNEPARQVNLQVFKTADDWLIQYDEVNENSDRIRRRAYYLKPNRKAIDDHKMPQFVPSLDSTEFPAIAAVLSTNGQQFTLYEGTTTLGTYDLPVYPAHSGRVKQVLLTPCTLVADATIIGGFILVYSWGHSGSSFSYPP